ncbi:hypothetical protein [Lapillicoccus sp.]|uniref:hypothetical protein n=1 Tax=Lapillicoccus sp. TaxID=1909287 RepID=UPI0025F3452B|nr:hypothetical protein [Lapillicoccus sp.]
MPSEWLTALLAFLGAGLGAGLSYAAALRGDRQRETAARHEEWGRRFTAALDDLGDVSARRRRLGQVLLERLASSDLASREERSLARDMLAEAARSTPEGRDLATLLGPDLDLDDIEFVPDTGSGPEPGAHREEEQP